MSTKSCESHKKMKGNQQIVDKVLINGLAKIIRNHSVTPKIANAFLEFLQDYLPALPNTVDELFSRSDIEFRAPLLQLDEERDINKIEVLHGQRRIETKVEEIQQDIKEKFKYLEDLLKKSSRVDESRVKMNENDLPGEEEVQIGDSLITKLPVKDLSDLEFVEDRLHETSFASYELENYLDTILIKTTGMDACAINLVNRVFVQGFLSKTGDASLLIETKLIDGVVNNVKDRYPKSGKEEIIDVIRNYLMLFETTPEINEEDVLVEEDEEYLMEEHSMDEIPADQPTEKLEPVRKKLCISNESFEIMIHSKEELRKIETRLRDEKTFVNDFRYYLDTIHSGGHPLGRYVALILKSVFSSEFLPSCRWGARENSQVSIKHTLISGFIVEKIRKEFPNYLESKVYSVIAQFFRTQAFYAHKRSE